MPTPVRREQRAGQQVGADADQVLVLVGLAGVAEGPHGRRRLDGHEGDVKAGPYDRAMSLPSRMAAQAGLKLAPKVTELAPGLTTTFVREALRRAIARRRSVAAGGEGGRGAARGAERQRGQRGARGDREPRGLRGHPGLRHEHRRHRHGGHRPPRQRQRSGASSSAGWWPASRTCAATTSTTRGCATRSWSCMLGEDAVNDMIRKKKLPAPPMALATAPVHDPDLDRILSAEVASELIARVAGKRIAFTVARRTPARRRRSSASARTPTRPGRSGATPTASSCPRAAR